MNNLGSFGIALVAVLLLAGTAVRNAAGQEVREDLSPCPGSAAEPSQSAAWPVAFCNRTAHDLVIEFHDNDCPARDWSRRGDVYQRTLRRGESKIFPLCYANEPAGRKPVPGTPTLRISGGKGVITTWTVVGDCGERSKALNLDARTFYDRGEYKTGIILLQYPAGASHCVADSSAASAPSPSAAAAATPAPAAPSAPAPAAAPSAAKAPVAAAPGSGAAASATSAAPAAATATAAAPAAVAAPATAAAPPVNNRGRGAPTLSAVVDAKDVIGRTVRVFAKDGAGYRCNFNLALTFTDGGTWNDRTSADITTGDADAPIATRKYLKSISKVQITSSRCNPM